ncbi:MAG TPA: agmatine deiminase family protein [Candidatus Nanoarchaeia archaeon]|nr:agmatine deiminase family protein [Candidatus Nanoarchaeia archaeon]
MNQTPRAFGYRMPAEWKKHQGTLLAWPHNPTTWEGIVKEAEHVWLGMIEALHTGEKILLLVNNAAEEKKVRGLLRKRDVDLKQIEFFHIQTADVWLRDSAPIFVTRAAGKKTERAAIQWTFNAWGEKYDDLLADKGLSERIAQRMNEKNRFVPGIVLEGGSIDVNGRGTLVTTEQCLLNKNRNPLLTKAEIEKYLKEYLGVSTIIWLKRGVAGDDTDGHVDDFARFVNEKTIVCAVEENEKDANYAVLKENFELLKRSVDQDGKKLTVVPLPMPKIVRGREGRLPASYANFYIGNKAVVVPIFNDKSDDRALEILQKCFPDKKVVGVRSETIVEGFGGLHCVTQQVPTIENKNPSRPEGRGID